MFHELPCQRDESTHQWQFWLHENYKCNIVRSDNEWAREAILWFLNWFLWMTKEEGFGFCKWMDCKLIVSTKLTNVHRQSSHICLFFLIWVSYLHSLSVHEMCLYSCQYVRSKMVGRIAPKCARTVKSAVCYTGMHPLCLKLKWCFAFSAWYLKREVLKYFLILRFTNDRHTKLDSTLRVQRIFWSTFLSFFGLDMPPVQHGDFP